ncbi:MAG: GNAT family N-acetyltransferase [Nitrospira sp.]|nr:GNAT family N-acetyltransferase [Nitrospira sp.]
MRAAPAPPRGGRRFANRESTLFIAHEGDTAIGFAHLYPSFSSVSLARIFILNDLFAQEQARRAGVASSLLSATASFAVSLGAVRLSLSTALTNDAAHALYRSAGWKRDQQFSVYHLALSV